MVNVETEGNGDLGKDGSGLTAYAAKAARRILPII